MVDYFIFFLGMLNQGILLFFKLQLLFWGCTVNDLGTLHCYANWGVQ